jgi:hypothetical protein
MRRQFYQESSKSMTLSPFAFTVSVGNGMNRLKTVQEMGVAVGYDIVKVFSVLTAK